MKNFQLNHIHIYSYSNTTFVKTPDGSIWSSTKGDVYPKDFNAFINSRKWINRDDELYLEKINLTLYNELFLSFVKEYFPNKYRNIINTKDLTKTFTAYKYDKNTIPKKKITYNYTANIIMIPPKYLIGDIDGGFLRIYQNDDTVQEYHNLEKEWNIIVFDTNLHYEITKINEGTQIILHNKLDYYDRLYNLANSHIIPDNIQEQTKNDLFQKTKKQMIHDLENINDEYYFDFEHYKKFFDNIRDKRNLSVYFDIEKKINEEFIIIQLNNYYYNYDLLHKEDFELYKKLKEKYNTIRIRNLNISDYEDYLYNSDYEDYNCNIYVSNICRNYTKTCFIIHQYKN